VVYVPTAQDPLTASTWAATTNSAMGYTSWTTNTSSASGQVPYMDYVDYPVSTNSVYDTYLIDKERNEPEMYAKQRGDICQYLGKTDAAATGYRLPMSAELGNDVSQTFSGRTDGWVRASSFPAAVGNAEGTTNITGTPATKSYAKNPIMGDVVFPASGARSFPSDNGDEESTYGERYLYRVGTFGYYWSGSGAVNLARGMDFDSEGWIYPNGSIYRSGAYAVRCVLD
jgi:hypothetical protein